MDSSAHTTGAEAETALPLEERVAQACRVLGRLELTRAATGHVSGRIPGTDRMLIRARGPSEIGVRYTTHEEVIEIDFDGTVIDPHDSGLAAPQEVFIHTELYKARPDVHAVIHMHPPTVVLFSICGLPLLPIYGAYDPSSARLAIDGIPMFDRSILINSPDLGSRLATTMGDAKVCTMHGHGVTTVGASVEHAALYLIQLNELARMNYQARLLGELKPISEEDQDAVRQRTPETPRVGGAPPTGNEAALWRYYTRLTEA